MRYVINMVHSRWIWDSVTAYWARKAPNEAVLSVAWITSKRESKYRWPAFFKERVDVHVLIERIVGAKAYFDATMRRAETVLAEFNGVRCGVDVTFLSPVRLALDVRDLCLDCSGSTR